MPLLSIFDNNKNIVSKSIFSLQNRNNHGIDLIFKVTPYPPPPKWITIESKTVMKDKFGDYSTPRGGKVSEYQEDSIDNLSKHLELSNISLKSKLNEYSIKKEEKISLQELTHDLLINKSISSNKEIIQGFKLTIGIDEKFNVSNNKKFDNLYIFEKL